MEGKRMASKRFAKPSREDKIAQQGSIPWPSANWLSPDMCLPPHGADPVKLQKILWSLSFGWGVFEPKLVGYPSMEETYKIQLLSGSHRWHAAKLLGMETIPVIVWPLKLVKAAYGNLLAWREIMESGDP